jgi:anti-sigma B factor antagonist
VQEFAVEVLHMDGSVVLALHGELDIGGVPALTEALRPIIARYDPGQVTVDCTRLTFMDASGLGALLKYLRHRDEADDEKPTLRGVGRALMRLLRVTGTNVLFDIEELTAAVRHGEPFDIDDA